MKRLLCTTALALTLAGGALASEQGSAFDTVTFEQGDFFASNLIGMRIYNSETEYENGDQIAANDEREWDDIGEINDILVSKDGEVRAVILGVGGFLGMGEKDVSISMADIRVLTEEGNSEDRFLVVNTSKEMLEQAPAFERTSVNEKTAATEKAEGSSYEKAEAEDGAMTEDKTETAAVGDAEVNQTETADATTNTEEMDANLEGTAAAALTRPEIKRDGWSEAEVADLQQLSTEEIEGSYVYGMNDETVGEIDTLLLSQDGMISEAVINVGGFLGLGEKPVAVDFDKIQVLRGDDTGAFRFYIDSTEEKLENMKEYQAD